MLDVWRLQLLREVSRRGTIKAAAEALCITASAVSQQLATLQREAGVPLLEKTGRRVRLTDAGLLLVRHADSITGAIAAAEADLASMQGQVSGTLGVAAFPTAARAIMPTVMAALYAAHPALRVALRDIDSVEALTALRMDEIDIAIVGEYDGLPLMTESGLEVHAFLHDPIYVVMPQSSAPAGIVDLSALRDEFWITNSENSQAYQVMLRACRSSGFEPRVRTNCRDNGVMIALIDAGLGVGLLPGIALRDWPSNASICLTSPALSRRVVAVFRPERRAHPALASMLSELDRFGASYARATSRGIIGGFPHEAAAVTA
jgi:DNA-binding transcriptional LysR family regulator